MKAIKLLTILTILSNVTKGQTYTYDDIFKTNKIYFYGYDFTDFKVIEDKEIGNEHTFIFGVIQFMNDNRKEKLFEKILKKDTVIFDQNTVNDLNSKIPKYTIIASGKDILGHSITKDSLQNIVNRYNTNGKTGIGFVQIVECFYKPKKRTSVWFVFFDISSKKILDAYENINPDADSWHGFSEYWSVGLSSAIGLYVSDHYLQKRKAYNKKNREQKL